jgi:hypothetical protein
LVFTERHREHVSSFNTGSDDANGDKIEADRRAARRYDIALDLRWKVIWGRRTWGTGTGTTLNLSSGGILFEADRQLSPEGLKVELSISWPVLLDNQTPLQLVVTGRIVRALGRRTAIHISQHQFRTAKRPT